MLPPPLDWARTGPGAGVGGLSEGYTHAFYPSLCFLNLTWTLAHERYIFLIALLPCLLPSSLSLLGRQELHLTHRLITKACGWKE